jgi:hypothetical protein
MESLAQFLFWVCVNLVQAKKFAYQFPKIFPTLMIFGEIFGTILVPSFLWIYFGDV